jgi:hypothetical protein
LDEAGEELIAILEVHRLCVVRIQLDTPKLSLPTYYNLLDRFVELFSILPVGPMSVGGEETQQVNARLCEDSERVFRVVRLAFTFVLACYEVRKDVGRHPRGDAGRSGVNALATLEAWRKNSSWYVRVNAQSEGSVSCGVGQFVVPLRAIPRVSVGGNLFLGSMVRVIAEVMSSQPRNPGGMMAASLLQMARRTLQLSDSIAHVEPKQARAIVNDWRRLPTRSADAAQMLLEINRVSSQSWNVTFSSNGSLPYVLPETERVFQQVAVTATLIALGLHPDCCRESLIAARSDRGLEISNFYRAWYDTPGNALIGWRASTQAPSNYRPDLVVRRLSDGAWLLIDAKLRQGHGFDKLFSQSAIKEIQAYMQEYQLSRSVLLVPSPNPNEWSYGDVEGDGFHIRAIGIPASKTLFDSSVEARSKLEEMWNL